MIMLDSLLIIITSYFLFYNLSGLIRTVVFRGMKISIAISNLNNHYWTGTMILNFLRVKI